MFCENCGNKIQEGHKFCTKCGHSSAVDSFPVKSSRAAVIADEKWWHRLLKVGYIISYIPLILIVIAVWSANSSDYNYYTRTYTDTSGAAFLWSCLAIAIYVVVIRLIKLAVLYVAFGQKPEWHKEFRKFF